mgnify:CR=1 FL=1
MGQGNIKYRKVKRTPQTGENAGKELWYATVVTDREMNFEEFVDHISSHNSPYSRGTVHGVMMDMLDCLKELRKRYKLFVLSNTNPYVMDWACSPAFSSKGKPLSDYFDKLYLSYQIGVTKPDRQIFDFLIADADILPSESLFIDDGAGNVQAARQLGFQTYCPHNGEDWRDALTVLLQKS